MVNSKMWFSGKSLLYIEQVATLSVNCLTKEKKSCFLPQDCPIKSSWPCNPCFFFKFGCCFLYKMSYMCHRINAFWWVVLVVLMVTSQVTESYYDKKCVASYFFLNPPSSSQPPPPRSPAYQFCKREGRNISRVLVGKNKHITLWWQNGAAEKPECCTHSGATYLMDHSC